MGFLDAPDDNPSPQAASPQEAPKTYGSFLSDNPPPEEKPVERVPDWSEIPMKAAVNAPGSAMEYAKNMVHPILHPIDTAEGLGKLALGTAQKIGLGKDFTNYEAYPEAVGKLVMDRYGSVDNFKTTLAKDPVGALADISMVLSGGETALGRLPGVVGKVGETLGTLSKVTDPLTLPTAAVKGTGHVAAAGLGYTTGAAMRPIEQAAKAGYEGGDAFKTFEANRTGAVEGEQLVRDAQAALNKVKQDRAAAYNLGMNTKVKPDTTILSFNDIGNAITDANKIDTFKGVPLDEAARATTDGVRQRLNDRIIQWVMLPPKDFHTAEGFDALKKSIGHIRDTTEAGTPERLVANKYYDAVRNTIKNQVPEYSKVMEHYADVSDTISQLEKSFSLPKDQRRINVDTALRKLSTVMRRNVNTNFGQREKLIDYLERAGNAPNLRNAIAGQALSSPEAHGLARVGPALIAGNARTLGGIGHALASLVVSAPSAAGYVASRAGKLARPFKYVPAKTPQALRAIGQYVPANTPTKITVTPDGGSMQNRGGAVGRALRATKR